MQLLIRCNGNLADIDCRGRLAAQRNSVIPDDIDAHEWVLLIDPGAVPPVTHTHALFAEESQSIRDNLVACRATAEHGTARPRTRVIFGSRITIAVSPHSALRFATVKCSALRIPARACRSPKRSGALVGWASAIQSSADQASVVRQVSICAGFR